MTTAIRQRGALYRRVHTGVNYRLRTVVNGKLAGHCRPTTVELLLTKRCHAKCVHCDIWKLKDHSADLPTDAWKTVLSDLRRWLGPVHIVLTGGEALLRPDATDIAAHASAIGLWTEVLTNGYWPNQARIEALARARPARVTLSLDGIGSPHDVTRGRDDFYERTDQSIRTLVRLRRDEGLPYAILLKTVVSSHSIEGLGRVAEYAADVGATVLYQPIEQNYETPDDPDWYTHSPNWPADPAAAVAAVRDLMALKARGLPIDNTDASLASMVDYFEDPDGLRLQVQAHRAHERRHVCGATTNLQVNPNGDVVPCWRKPPVGNVKEASVRDIWRARTAWWRSGCCMEGEA